MNVPFLDLGWQEKQIKEDREKRFAQIIDTTSFILGESVSSFEKEFAAYCDRTYALGISDGTHALSLIFQSLGLKEGDEVITIPTTFFASAAAMVHAGLRP